MSDRSKATACPKCGSYELGEGKQSGYAAVTRTDGMFGSPIIYTICTNCGFIVESYVKKPEKFKKRY